MSVNKGMYDYNLIGMISNDHVEVDMRPGKIFSQTIMLLNNVQVLSKLSEVCDFL